MGAGRVILPAVQASARRTIVAWTRYDFANSAFAAIVLSTVYPAYYANVVVGNARGGAATSGGAPPCRRPW
jgi:MFS-type transporter involved in bile tolerance (Atg22 family)